MSGSNLSFLEWNINQRGGKGNGLIPDWVLDEVIAKTPDIIVLTEFCTECEGGDKFIEALESKGYQCFTSGNPKGNDVLIAVKKKKDRIIDEKNDVYSVPCYDPGESSRNPTPAYPDIPENLRVDIHCNSTILTVVGVRIRTIGTNGDFGPRRKEFKWILRQLEGVENPIIIAGDFNNNRRGAETAFDREKRPSHQRWSMTQINMLSKEKGFMRITPSGSSIWEAAKEDPDYEFAEDHFIVKGIQGLTLFPYDRSFNENDEDHYPAGEDFQWFEGFEDGEKKICCARNIKQFREYNKKYGKSHRIDSGYPDHAILRGEFTLADPDSPADQ